MTVEYALLRFLIDEGNHGYKLQKLVAQLRAVYPVANINVYPILRQLERDGLVTSTTALVDSRVRKTYEITEAGREAFENWLDDEPESRVPTLRDPVMLKLTLETHRAHAFDWLGGAIADAETEARRLERVLQAGSSELSDVSRLASQEIIDAYRRRAEFLREVVRRIEARSGAASRDRAGAESRGD